MTAYFTCLSVMRLLPASQNDTASLSALHTLWSQSGKKPLVLVFHTTTYHVSKRYRPKIDYSYSVQYIIMCYTMIYRYVRITGGRVSKILNSNKYFKIRVSEHFRELFIFNRSVQCELESFIAPVLWRILMSFHIQFLLPSVCIGLNCEGPWRHMLSIIFRRGKA